MTVAFQRHELTNTFARIAVPMSHEKFMRLLDTFKAECDKNMDGGCVLRAKLMSSEPFHQARIEPDHDEILALENAANERHVIARLDDPKDIPPTLYRRAKYIEITAMTTARAQGGADYKAEFAGGCLTLKNKRQVDISLQAMNGPIKLSL